MNIILKKLILKGEIMLRYYGKSVKGKDHYQNEDGFLIIDEKKLFAVADGVSNPPDGRKAAVRTLSYLKKFFKNDLLSAVMRTNSQILDDKLKDPEIGYTTLTTTNIVNNRLKFVHIGDSSIFLIRKFGIEKLTKSHSLFGTSVLTQVIGMKEISPQTGEIELQNGDIIIICTDGITSVLNENEIKETSTKLREPKKIVEELIKSAEQKFQSYNDDKTAISIVVKS
jgi:protein phosphatase